MFVLLFGSLKLGCGLSTTLLCCEEERKMTGRTNKYLDILLGLISNPQFSFDENLFTQLPKSPGI